jgi:hypothetical protein
MPGEVRDGGHDLRDARLVVGAEQRVAAGGHDVVAGLLAQLRHLLGVEHRAVAGELERPAVVVAVHDRLDAGAGRVRRRVDVRDQAHGRHGAAVVRGERGVHVAVLVERRVLEPDLQELLDEHAREVELAGGARTAVAVAG